MELRTEIEATNKNKIPSMEIANPLRHQSRDSSCARATCVHIHALLFEMLANIIIDNAQKVLGSNNKAEHIAHTG